MTGGNPERACPFCGVRSGERTCPGCRRDVTAARRPCASCGKLTPTAEKACCQCGVSHKSDMRWKVPLIIFLFVAAIALSIVLQLSS